MSDAARAQRAAAGDVRHDERVPRTADGHVVERDILHQRRCIDALLKPRAEQVVEGQPRDREDRRAIEMGVVESVHRCTAPGPVVARQTPRRPVALAHPEAMNAQLLRGARRQSGFCPDARARLR